MPHPRPNKADLVIAPRWIVPVEPPGLVLEHHAVVLNGDRIADVLPYQAARQRFPDAPALERPEHALIPGLVNAHTHAGMSLLRGLADDLPLQDWLAQHIWPAENRWVSGEFVRDGTRLAMLEMVRGGITCFNDMYYFPDVSAGLAVEHQVRAAIGMIVIEQPTPWAQTVEEYFSKGLAVHDQYREHPLVQMTYAPHAPYTVSDGTLSRLRRLADELDVPVHMHVHETAAEIEDSVRSCGERPLQRLERLHLLDGCFMAVHMAAGNAADLATLREHKASIVHCPSSNLKLASGLFPAAEAIEAGINVAIGTDGAASNNTLDMFAEMRLAALLAKATSRDTSVVPAAQALQMATLNGARALGLDDRIGSITPGKYADLACVNLRDAATQPVHHVLSQLVYAASRSLVTDVWVAGEFVLLEGRPVTIDEQDTLARAEAWRSRLAGDSRA